MATPKHTEPPSLVSTWRKNKTKNSNTCHRSTMINRLNRCVVGGLHYVVSWRDSQHDYIDKYANKTDLQKKMKPANIKNKLNLI